MHLIRMFLFILAASLFASQAFAAPDQEALRQEISAAWAAAEKAAIAGPVTVPLVGVAKIQIPANAAYIPASEANNVMKALGNRESDQRAGIIIPKDGKLPWLIDVTWIADGYVSDEDAKDWDSEAMLESMKEGTAEDNKDRETRGIPALDIVGWIEKPTYDAKTNRLVWSIAANNRGAAQGEPQNVNYNTYALGREGYVSLDLITGSDTIGTDKAIVNGLLGSLQFEEGKRYADFNSSTDKVAAYGLGALVGAVALKKMGLFAVILAFLAKFAKIAIIALLGGFAVLRNRIGKLFGRKSDDVVDYTEAAETPAETEEQSSGTNDRS